MAVKIKSSTVEISRFDWPCPDCGASLHKLFEMPNNREMSCDDCSNKRWEASKAKWIKKFKASVSWLVGATIFDVEPDLEQWFESEPENGDIFWLQIEKDGKQWRLFTSSDVPYLYIEQIEAK